MQTISFGCSWRIPMMVALTAIVLSVSTSCGPRARATGEVYDGFGKPLAGVDVSIPGTTLKGTTGSSGEYSISYVPGKF